MTDVELRQNNKPKIDVLNTDHKQGKPDSKMNRKRPGRQNHQFRTRRRGGLRQRESAAQQSREVLKNYAEISQAARYNSGVNPAQGEGDQLADRILVLDQSRCAKNSAYASGTKNSPKSTRMSVQRAM